MSDHDDELAYVRQDQARRLDEATAKSQARIDSSERLLARLERMRASRGIPKPTPTPRTTPSSLRVINGGEQRGTSEQLATQDAPAWDEMVTQARARNPGRVSVDDLLTKEELNGVYADLVEISTTINARRRDALFNECARELVRSIVNPFGLGRVVSAWDRVGGDVLTLHNAAGALHKTDAELAQYPDAGGLRRFRDEMNAPFDREPYTRGFSQQRAGAAADAQLTDGYTGRPLDASDMDLDHVISARELHDDARAVFHLGRAGVGEFATSNENLSPTASSINRSKRDLPLEAWMEKDHKGQRNADRYGVDEERARAVDQRARGALEEQVNQSAATDYAKQALLGGVATGLRFGFQQAFGLLLLEAVLASYEELRSLWADGVAPGSSLASELKVRLERVVRRVAAQWRSAIDAFVTGAFTGFVSSIVTFIINLFVTTGKRAVRMIREGLFGVVRAAKIFINPPAGLPAEDAYQMGLKLLATTIGVAAGIAVEEAVEKLILSAPYLAPLSPVLSAAVAGVIGGMTSAMLIYYIDRSDLFGARARELAEATHDYLEEGLDELLQDVERDVIALQLVSA